MNNNENFNKPIYDPKSAKIKIGNEIYEVESEVFGKPIQVVKNVTVVVRKSKTSDKLDVTWHRQSNSIEVEDPENFDENNDIE